MHDNRLTIRLIDYWNLLRKDNPFPDIQRFNTAAMEDIWPRCFRMLVMSSQEGKNTYKYDYLGEKIVSVYGKDLSGMTVTQKMQFPGSRIIKRMDEVCQTPQPVTDEGQFVNERNVIVKYRACLVPFGNAGKITHIIAGLSWREF